jgi:hypothetical protein
MRAFVNRYRRRGLVVMATDFFDPAYPAALRVLHHHGFDCMAIQVNERAEIAPPVQGDVELVDCETGGAVPVRVTPEVKALYAEELELHYGELRRLCRAFDQGHFAAVSDESLEDFILGIFRRSGFLRR